MKIVFDNLTLTDPIISIKGTFDDFETKEVIVTARFKHETEAYDHIRTIGSFPYDVTWEDENVWAFIDQWKAEHSVE